jgi:hypothetical protein
MKTKVIDNFRGSMTQYVNGDLNSGYSYVVNTFGNDPFTKPGSLTWCNASEQINSAGNIITDLIMAGKERVESGILYVYAVGHTGRVYKIQVNRTSPADPNYDNPVLLTTITSGTPTFTRGGFITFFGSTEQIYIGHDKGVTELNFDGTGEAVVGIAGSWTATVPRPLKQFLGKLYAGNGNNLVEIIDGGTVATYAKLSPAFPNNTQVRDLDITSDGTYLQAVVTGLAMADITSASQDTTPTASVGSFIFKWNGTDVGYTSYNTFPTFSMTANTIFGDNQYTFGYDQFGSAVYAPVEKRYTSQEVLSPLPNAVSSTGNLLMWMSPLYYDGAMEADIFFAGTLDFEVGPGYWDLFGQFASGTETDIIQVPYMMPVSNFGLGASSNGYTDNIYGTSKVYFSTFETSSGTSDYKLWKWTPPSSPSISSGEALENAVYQTQTQLFSKKILVKEVRIYGEPWVTDNSFKIDLIGSNGTAMVNGSYTFTAGSTLTVGDDFAWYNPGMEPTYALGLYITNLGTANHTINKIEVDYTEGGK